MSQKLRKLIAKLSEKQSLDHEELSYLISQSDQALWQELWQEADRIRHKYVGDAVHLRGLVEFSNYCRCNCNYCGLRRDNKEVLRYRLEPEEIVKTALFAAELGYGTVVLQSGEDPFYTAEVMEEIILKIKAQTDLAITLSIGERSKQEYAMWRQAGADRYLLRHETADPKLYSALHPGRKLESRIECLQTLHSLGYEVGSGFMVGLPGQSAETLAADLLLLQELDVHMVGIGPFIPSPQTPLEKETGGSFDQTVNLVALARLLLPWANIPATTAMGTLRPDGREITLASGANVVMPNVTPTKYRTLYQIYPGKICTGEEAGECRLCIESRIKSIGRTIGQGQGGSLKYLQRSWHDGKYAQGQ